MEGILSQARALLAITPGRWRRLADVATRDQLAREPAPGEWSALGCLQHLLDTETHVFPVRVRAILDGRDFPAFDPDADGTLVEAVTDATAMAARFAEARAASVALLGGVTDADLARTGRHAELGVVSLDELLHHWIGHDLMHTVQAERALMQPFIAGSGPWRANYADHEVSVAAD